MPASVCCGGYTTSFAKTLTKGLNGERKRYPVNCNGAYPADITIPRA